VVHGAIEISAHCAQIGVVAAWELCTRVTVGSLPGTGMTTIPLTWLPISSKSSADKPRSMIQRISRIVRESYESGR
jgi:hypothetical protein